MAVRARACVLATSSRQIADVVVDDERELPDALPISQRAHAVGRAVGRLAADLTVARAADADVTQTEFADRCRRRPNRGRAQPGCRDGEQGR
jgi:hypothetical protein